MKRLMHGAILAGLAISGLSGVAVAQQAPPRGRNFQAQATSAPAILSTLFTPSTPSPLYQTLIDELTVTDNAMTVRKLLPILKEKVPGFQYIAEDGPWADQHVPSMELRNVTILEVFDVLQRWNPSFHWDVVSGGNANAGVPIIILGHDRPAPPVTYSGQPAVQVSSLSIAIDRQLDRDGINLTDRNAVSRKKALAEVMSLLENVAKQASLPGAPVEIGVHDETETLVVKAYSNQSEAISRAVMSFDPPMVRDGTSYTTLTTRDRANVELSTLQNQLNTRDNEISSLKIELQAERNNRRSTSDGGGRALGQEGGSPQADNPPRNAQSQTSRPSENKK